MPSVTYYQRLNDLPDFHKIRYWDSSKKLLSKMWVRWKLAPGEPSFTQACKGQFLPILVLLDQHEYNLISRQCRWAPVSSMKIESLKSISNYRYKDTFPDFLNFPSYVKLGTENVHKNSLSNSHALLKDVTELISVVSTIPIRCGCNSVQHAVKHLLVSWRPVQEWPCFSFGCK